MNTQQLLDDYNRLNSGKNDEQALPAMRLEPMQTQPARIIASPDDLQAELETFNAETGWLQYTGGQGLLDELPLRACHPQHGPLLNAELANAEESLRITHLGNGWQWVRTRRNDGPQWLADTVTHTLHGHPGRLVYTRYWQQEADDAVAPFHAALVTIEQGSPS